MAQAGQLPAGSTVKVKGFEASGAAVPVFASTDHWCAPTDNGADGAKFSTGPAEAGTSPAFAPSMSTA